MASIISLFRKTLKRSANAVRRVGKITRRTVKRGTNAIGLTKRRRSAHRKGSRSAHRRRRHSRK